MTEYVGLAFTADESHLYATISPASERSPLDLETLRGLIKQLGYGAWLLHEPELLALVAQYNAQLEAPEVLIGERRDASFSVEISEDAMQVWVDVLAAYVGKPTLPDEINLVLGKAGVAFGIDQAAVASACAATVDGRFLVASGRPAEDGEDTRFELLIEDARDRSPQVDELGLIDFRELGAIPTVSADQPLMRRIPSTSGTVGHNVRGEPLMPVPGNNAGFAEKMIGAYVAPEDSNLLRAVFSGQPVHFGNGVMVEQVLRVRNVNMASGNITFDGTVHVEGEILPGMKVHATGDIVVGGVVDGAELDAGGDVRISGGVIAKSRVHAGGTVSARFAENAQIFAGVAIAIDDAALQCDMQANNQIVVGLKSPQRGRLAGGSARSMLLIRTPILGMNTGGVTHLVLGVNPVLDAEYQALLELIAKRRLEEDNLEKLVKHLTAKGDKTGMLDRVKASWQQAIKEWAKLLPEREALEKKLALVAGAKVDVGVGVAGAIDMTFGNKAHRVRQSYEMGVFMAEGERLMFTDPEGNARPAL